MLEVFKQNTGVVGGNTKYIKFSFTIDTLAPIIVIYFV